MSYNMSSFFLRQNNFPLILLSQTDCLQTHKNFSVSFRTGEMPSSEVVNLNNIFKHYIIRIIRRINIYIIFSRRFLIEVLVVDIHKNIASLIGLM